MGELRFLILEEGNSLKKGGGEPDMVLAIDVISR